MPIIPVSANQFEGPLDLSLELVRRNEVSLESMPTSLAKIWTTSGQFDEPQRNFSSPSFGKITNALNDGREFQLALRLLL